MIRPTLLSISAALLLLVLLSGCVVLAPGHLPPGQVQKATGFNPASGKVKHH